MDSKYAKVYYDPGHPASYAGPKALRKSVGGTLKEAKEWLESQDTYTLHRPARKRFPRNKIQVAGIDDQFEADLIDMQSVSKHNNRFKYILTVIDSLSKYAWAIPIKDKTGDSIVKAFTTILKERTPRKLRTDKGKEFLNAKFQSLLKKHGVIFFTSNNDTKAAIVERFNRTLQSRLYRYFTSSKSQRYVDVLPDVIVAYNKRKHGTTGVPPISVNVYNAEDIWRKVYQFTEKKKLAIYKEGDHVRISKAKGTFEKGYKTNWTSEVFVIDKVIHKHLPEYKLLDLTGEHILGKFLHPELQSVKYSPNFKVDKVLRKRGSGRKVEVLVQWKGYPDTLKSWIPQHNLKQYQDKKNG
jgi:hypothetical protein